MRNMVLLCCCVLISFYSHTQAQDEADQEYDILPTLEEITRENTNELEMLFSLQCEQGLLPSYLANNNVFDIEFSPTSNQLIVVMQGAMCLYNLNTPQNAPLVIETPNDPETFRPTWARDVTFHPTGEYFFAIHQGDDTVRKWNARTGEEMNTIIDAVFNSTVSFSLDGEMVVTGSDLGIRIWDVSTEELLIDSRTGAHGSPIVWNSDGSRIIAVGRGLYFYSVYDGPRLFLDERRNAWSGENLVAIGGLNDELLIYAPFAEFNDDGTIIRQVLINTESEELLDQPDIRGNQFAFSPADPYLLTGSSLGGVDFYDAEALQVINRLQYISSDSLSEFGLLEFNHDGSLLTVTPYFIGRGGRVNIYGIVEG